MVFENHRVAWVTAGILGAGLLFGMGWAMRGAIENERVISAREYAECQAAKRDKGAAHVPRQSAEIALHPLPPISLRSIPNVSDAFATITTLAQEFGLRRLTALEASLPLNRIPEGSFGFISGSFGEYLRQKRLDSIRVRRFGLRARELDALHFTLFNPGESEPLILGYCSEKEAAALDILDGKLGVEVSLYAFPWNEARTLVLVPISRFTTIEWSQIEAGEPANTMHVWESVIR